MPLASQETIIREFPSVRINLSETVGVELADEAGEIVVLEEAWEEDGGEDAPPNGLVSEKSMCFSDSTLTMNDGMLTICLPTLMWRCLIRTRAWWMDLAMPALKTRV